MNIYWCYPRNEFYGMHILADTRNEARLIMAGEIGEEYININGYTIIKHIEAEKPITITCADLDLLKKYKLNMACEYCDCGDDCLYPRTRKYMQDKHKDFEKLDEIEVF